MTSGDSYTNVLLEEMRDSIQAIVEAVIDVQKKVEPIPQMQADIAELKTDMRLVKYAVKDTNSDLKLLDRRVTKLENNQA